MNDKIDGITGKILERYSSVLDNLPPKNKGNLKFGRRYVSVSSIASQYYCEKKLELQYRYPRPPTKKMLDGIMGHDVVTTSAIPLTREEAYQEALKPRERPICIYEIDLAWYHNSVPILGKVDEVWINGGEVSLVSERKFSNRLEIFPSYHIQAQLYCLGMGEMGFNNYATKYCIQVYKRSCNSCYQLMELTCPLCLLETADYQCSRGEGRTYIFNFQHENIISELNWALDFWLGKRATTSTENPAKCNACEYATICDSSLVV